MLVKLLKNQTKIYYLTDKREKMKKLILTIVMVVTPLLATVPNGLYKCVDKSKSVDLLLKIDNDNIDITIPDGNWLKHVMEKSKKFSKVDFKLEKFNNSTTNYVGNMYVKENNSEHIKKERIIGFLYDGRSIYIDLLPTFMMSGKRSDLLVHCKYQK